MKEYNVLIEASVSYTIKANSKEEAIDKALEYWDGYIPYTEVSEADENDE